MDKQNQSNESQSIWPHNTSHVVLDIFGDHSPAYSDTSSLLLTILYVPIFLMSLIGNVTALIVLVKTVLKKYRMKTAYIINLVIADLSGKFLLDLLYISIIKLINNQL